MRYKLLITGHECDKYVKACFRSINNIDFDRSKWSAYFIVDGGHDNTVQELSELMKQSPSNFKAFYLTENIGAGYAREVAIQHLLFNGDLHDEDVILLIGMDDAVKPDCLNEIDKHYQAGKWMTYGNYIDQFDAVPMTKNNLYFDKSTHKDRTYRKELYRSTAINSFKYFLYKRIPYSDLQVNGEWQRFAQKLRL